MRLSYVQIKNFRSIEEVKVEFDPTCRVLVGINESGKSNILRALSLLKPTSMPVKKDDLREALPDEDQIEESLIRFVFKFEKKESDKLFEMISVKIATNTKNPEIVSTTKPLTLKDFCITRDEGIYKVDILKENKFFSSWSFDNKYKLLSGYKKPTSACPTDFIVELKGQKYQLSQYKLIRAVDFKDVPETYLEDATQEDLSSLVSDAIIQITKDNVPDTRFWEYSEDNLLPSHVIINDFANNPDTCIPLKNMFALAGITEIKSSIDEKRKGTDNQFQNYLNGVAKKTTNHFRSVWKEYKNIEFSLQLNADKIIPGIKERNVHDFARRSDGFKRFVSFLLMISVNVKTDNINNTLLLIDEPDISLHPTGARYLRDELIRISKTNYVVYSTHSIFMIDSEDINRHYIVTKKDEITSIAPAGESNIADEEVLYNALGYSVFAVLKEKNIIFEGWNDKRLFQIAIENASATQKKKYKELGICHARGVKSIKTITPMIELAKRKCTIISDSDVTAKEQQKLYSQEKGYGDWKIYQEVEPTIEAITGEDFIKNDFITEQVKEALSGASMPTFDDKIIPNKNKLVAILKWLTDNGMTKDQANATIIKIKHSIFENLKYKNIEADYNKLIENIST